MPKSVNAFTRALDIKNALKVLMNFRKFSGSLSKS